VLIIRRVNCINTSGRYVGDLVIYRFGWNQACIPHGHLHRVTYTRGCIDRIDSHDDEHLVVRNM